MTRTTEDDIDKEHGFKDRLKIFVFLLVVILIGLYFYARYVGTTGLVINEINIINKDIPDSFNGLKVVQFSDLHYGRTINETELKNLVKEINKLEPDIVLFTGDLIDKDVPMTDKMVDIITTQLSKIETTVGKYAVTGNHDYKNTFFQKIMTDSEFNLLTNNYDVVYYKSIYPIFLGGLGNYVYNKADIKSVMTYFDTNPDLYKIIIVHEPDYMSKIKAYDIDLVLAGHSHNGQVRLPFIGKIYTPPKAKNYYLPHYKIGETNMYISSGIGCSTVNVRLFDRPSINLYRLSNK